MNAVCSRKDERGFTLLEMLVSLSLLIVVVSLFPSFLRTMTESDEATLQTAVFFNHLARDIREAHEVAIGLESIEVTKKNGDRYLIERVARTNQIRRMRNRQGHVLMLDDVRSFHCTASGRLVTCAVERLNGDTLERTIAFYSSPPPVVEEDEADE